jgi:hypothetical protein
VKQGKLKIIYKNMDNQANLMDARDALIKSNKYGDKAIFYIDKAMEEKRFANRILSKGAA